MDYLEDLKMVYKKAWIETKNRIVKNPIVLLLPLVFGFGLKSVEIIFASVFGTVPIMAGFAMPIIFSLILSGYCELLSDLNFYNRLSFRGMKNSFVRNLGSIYSTYIIIIIASWFVSSGLVNFIIILLFNPLIESIYIKDKFYIEAYSYSLDFMRTNPIHWLLPFGIYVGLLVLIFGGDYSFLFSQNVMELALGPINNIYELASRGTYYLKIIGVELLTALYVVFRGALFNILAGSTMRKRKYMGEFQ
ncbi:hypothetical protein [Peptoniphilus catoniae]|uniref:hypothetical protein n=1 Tax=Peptoniphilus catoniae TaxID=1660341 RepID=UPI0010FF3C35|nr:hypothetical protein [Peptoniphilus catoniae]